MQEYKVEGSRRNKKFVEALLPSMFKQLGLTNCRKALLIRIADECGDNNGMTLDLTKATGTYLIVIRPNRRLKEIGMTLAHEMVHVKQLARGVLKQGARYTTWAGKKYSNKTTPYLDMPWEVQAFSQQELILRRAFEE